MINFETYLKFLCNINFIWMYNINFVQFVALFSLGRIWEIYTKYIFLMFYWPEERNELALGTIRYSHHTFSSTAGNGTGAWWVLIVCERQWYTALMMKRWRTCPPPVRQVYVRSWVDISITLSAATNEDGCVKCVTPSWSWSSAHFA